MRRVFPLQPDVRFDAVSDRFEALGAEITQLVSCTFPSRPEAKSAIWSVAGEPVARYRYEPDIELRWLAWDRPDLFDVDPDGWGLFDSWDALGDALESNEWGKVFRAAAAFRVAAELTEPGVDGEARLADSLSLGAFTARAAASQLAEIATGRSRAAIETALESSKNVETRVDLRRALDRIDMQDFTRR